MKIFTFGQKAIPSGAGSQGRIYGGVFIHHHENGADNETPGNLVICQDNTIHREGDSMNYLIILGAGAALAVAAGYYPGSVVDPRD